MSGQSRKGQSTSRRVNNNRKFASFNNRNVRFGFSGHDTSGQTEIKGLIFFFFLLHLTIK
jgi:hypothetical protein